MRKTMLAAMLASVLLTAGCGQVPVRPLAASTARPSLTPYDRLVLGRASIELLNSSTATRSATTTVALETASDPATARSLLPAAEFPTQTFGRRLLAIFHGPPPGIAVPDYLVLVYQNGLYIREDRYARAPTSHGPPPPWDMAGRNATTVAGLPALVEPLGLQGWHPPLPTGPAVEWATAQSVPIIIQGHGLTAEQVVAVARSMKP